MKYCLSKQNRPGLIQYDLAFTDKYGACASMAFWQPCRFHNLQPLTHRGGKCDDPAPARLDADRTAKPLTVIGVYMDPNHCFYGIKPFHNPLLINRQTGERIPLYRDK